MTAVTERVERGAALLDEKRPGWWKGIDLDYLDIECPNHCVAGQLGGYTETLNDLGLHDADEYEYGFDGGSFEETRALTPAWRDLIAQRREQAQVTA